MANHSSINTSPPYSSNYASSQASNQALSQAAQQAQHPHQAFTHTATPTTFGELEQWLDHHRVTEIECLVPDLTGVARG